MPPGRGLRHLQKGDRLAEVPFVAAEHQPFREPWSSFVLDHLRQDLADRSARFDGDLERHLGERLQAAVVHARGRWRSSLRFHGVRACQRFELRKGDFL
jgi:hypothetical protein